MNNSNSSKSYVIDKDSLPELYPTHLHDAGFWEALGRTVATYSFLEEVLGKAIFVFSATRPYSSEEIDEAYENWRPFLEKALSDTLGPLIDTYGKAVRENVNSTIQNLDELLVHLRAASKLRNVLCHGSWRTPNEAGGSVPLFVNRQKEIFETPVDIAFLIQTQKHVSELSCEVISTVTHMGLQFPGSGGPGEAIMKKNE